MHSNKEQELWSQTAWFQLWLYTLLTAQTWRSCLTSSCPSFTCKLELIIRTLLDT